MENREDAAKHLRVFEDKSEYHSEDSTVETFIAGFVTTANIERRDEISSKSTRLKTCMEYEYW